VSPEAKPPEREQAVALPEVRAVVVAWWGVVVASSEAQLSGLEAVMWWGVQW
jgi:hypothetical protein